MGKKNKKISDEYRNLSSKGNARFRAVSQATKDAVLNEYNSGTTDKRQLMDMFKISMGEVKRIIKNARHESKPDVLFSEYAYNPKRFGETSIGNVIDIVADNRMRKYNRPDPEPQVTETSVEEPVILTEDIKIIEEPAIIPDTSVNPVSSVVETKDNVTTGDTTSKPRKGKIPDDVIRNIMNDVKLDRFTLRELSEKYSVSISTINNIKHGVGRYKFIIASQVADDKLEETVKNDTVVNINDIITLPALPEDDPQMKAVTKQVEKVISNESILNARVKVRKAITVGMIYDRHDMPVRDYVFQNVDNNLITDYPQQYNMAYTRIKNLTGNDPKGKTIVLYVTGLSSVLATIIKVCFDLKCNLVLMHYYPHNGTYTSQTLLSNEEDTISSRNICPPELDNINCRNLYTYGCSASQFVKQSYGYQIVECITDNDIHFKFKDVTLFTSQDDAWNYWRAICENAPSNYSLILNKVCISPIDHKLIVQKTMSKMINDNR